MPKSPRPRRWTGWSSRKPSCLRPFPGLGLEQLEARETPATITWTGGGGAANTTWTNTANWLGGVVPTGAAANSEDLVFPAIAGGASLVSTNNLPAGGTFNSITFSSGGYALSGNAITLGISTALGASGFVVVQDGAANNVMSIPTTLGAAAGIDQTFSVGAAGASLRLTGSITGTTGSSLVKDGVGTLSLEANNSGFTGPIKVVNSGGTLAITNVNALGSSVGAADNTTVGTNATLAVSNVAGPIVEQLLLNGPGVSNAGALLNLAGNNTWAGPVILDTDSSIGSAAGVMNITGVISDTGAGHNLTKEGAGEIQFNPVDVNGNTYQGLTTVNHGTLTIGHALALGVAGTPASGTLVNRTLTGAGQLRLAGAAAGGLRVLNEQLTLNGPGTGTPVGAFYNLNGNNTWAGPVLLGSPTPNGFSVSIGAAAATNLTISGVVSSPNISGLTLTKTDTGRLILNNANTFNWSVVVAAGALNVRDSNALGTTGANTTVNNGAALELEVDTGTDTQGVPPVTRNLGFDSVTSDQDRLTFSEPLNISGRGIGNTGALRSITGINTWAAVITLGRQNADAAIGVDQDLRGGHPTADATYFQFDYSLTASGSIVSQVGVLPTFTGTNLVKRNAGHLILPVANTIRVNSDTNLAGKVFLEQGWTTIQNNNALGFRETQLGDTVQPDTIVSGGAALHLKPITPTSPPLVVPENITLAGNGPIHPYNFISQKGSLVNIGGANTWGGDILLNGPSGIGVEQVALTSPLPPAGVVSEMTVTGALRNAGAAVGGITKLGSRRLILQGEGTYTGSNVIAEGTIRIQSDTALGRFTSGTFTTQEVFTDTQTMVQSGAVLELQSGIAVNNGGISAGIQVSNELLLLGAMAQQVSVAGVLGSFSLTYAFNATGATETSGPLGLFLSAGQLEAALVAMPNLLAHAGTISVTKNGSVFTIVYGNALSAELNFANLAWRAINGAEVTVAGGPASVLNLTDDNAWRGPIDLMAGTRIDVASGTRLSLLGVVGDAANPLPAGSALTKRGPGELVLGGTNTFRGAAQIDRGIVTALSSSAFGVPAGGTTITTGAQLQLQGSVTIAGEPLNVRGSGWAASQLVSLGGTAGVFSLTFLGQTTTALPYNATALQVQGALAVLSRVTNPPEVQLVQVNGAAGTFTLTFNGQTTTAITAGAAATTVQAALEVLSTIGAGNVSVLPNGTGGYAVLFIGTLGGANQTQMTITAGTGLTGTTSTAVDGGGTGSVTVVDDPTVLPAGTKLLVTFGGTLSSASLPIMTVANAGGSAASNAPQTAPIVNQRWFSTGPAPTNNGQTLLNLPTSGRITGVVTDYTDANVIYVSTAGGGAWKTKNGGLTWLPLFDGPTAPPAALMNGGSITISPTDPRILVFATGESNAAPTGVFPLNGPSDNYAGSGVYRSTDSGLTWTLLTGTGGNPIAGQAISKVVLSGTNVFVATGVTNTATTNPSVQNGVFSATPGIWRWNGTTWFNMTASVSVARSNTPGQAPFDPPPPNMGNGLGPPRTPGPDDDYRLNFPQTNATWSDLVILGGTLYATLGESTQAFGNFATLNGVYRTGDLTGTQPAWFAGAGTAAGVDQRTASASLFGDIQNGPVRNGYMKLTGVVVPIVGNHVLYASVASPVAGAVGTFLDIQRSVDGGVTWAVLGNLPPATAFGTGNPAMGRYNQSILVRDLDPRVVAVNTAGGIPDNDQNTVYLAGFNTIFRTTDGGATAWTALPTDAAGAYPANQFHALHLDINNRLITGSDGGIWGLNNTTNAFANLNGTLAVTMLNSVDPHPTNPNRAVGGSQDNGTQAFNNSLAWSQLDLGGANGIATSGVVRYKPTDPNTIYAVRDGALRKSTNGGGTWTTIRTVSTTNYYFPFVIDSQQPERILLGGQGGLQESTVGGTGNAFINLNAPINPTAIAIATFQGPFVADPSFLLVPDQLSNTYDQNTIYVTNGTSVAVTKNRGLSWVTRTPTFTEQNYSITFVDGMDNSDQNQITTIGTGPYPFATTLTQGNATATLPLRNENQSVNVVGTNGTFTLTFNGQTTPPLPFNATALDVQTALNNLTSINAVLRNEIQQIVIGGTGAVGTDTFTLTFNGQTTGPLQLDANAATVQGALQILSTIGGAGGTVSVTGAGTAASPFIVTFGGAVPVGNTNVVQITGAGSVAAVTVTGQTIRTGGAGRVTVALGTVVGGGQITDLAVDPSNRDVVYATMTFTRGNGGPSVFRSTNAGQTWTDISGVGTNAIPTLPAWKVVIDPRTNTLYVGNDNGVWTLANASTATTATAVWSAFGAGMPRVQVRDLVLNQSLNTLTAATHGRGAFQLFLPNYEVASGAVRAVSGANVWTGPVTLAGATAIGAAGTQQIQNGIAAASLNILGTISDSVAPPGPFTLRKIGAGTVTLSGSNTYTGQTLVQEGILQVNNARALGAATAAGNTVVIPTQVDPSRPNPSAALELRSDLELEPVTLFGDGFSFNGHFTGAMRNVAGVNTYTGPLTMATKTTLGVDSGTTLIIGAKTGLGGNGSVTDGGANLGFDKEGTGTLVLANANTYGGLTKINQGAIQVQQAMALGSAAVGTTVLDGAQLQLATPTSGPFAGTPVVVASEPLLLSGTGIANATPFGTGALRNTAGNNTYSGPIAFTITPNFAPPSNPGSQIAIGVDNLADNLTVTSVITENNTPAYLAQFGLSKVGAGRLTLTAANLYTGLTSVRGGTLRVQNPTALGPAVSSEVQTLNVIGTTGTYTLTINGQTTGALAAAATAAQVQTALNTLTSMGGIGARVSETPTLNGKILTITFNGIAGVANTNLPQLTATPSVGLLVIAATPQNGGLGTVVDAGASLELDGSGLGVAEVLTINGTGVGGTGALTNSGGSNAYTGPVTLGSNAGLGAAAGSTLLMLGTILDPTPLTVPAPSLTKGGAGTVVFPTANAYGGQTVINDGALRILDPLSLGGIGRNEVQHVSAFASAGNFSLNFNGQTTAPIAFNAPAATVAAALNALTNAGRQEIQTVLVTGPLAGSFTLTFNGQTTAPIAVNETAANVQTMLQALSTIGAGNVVVGRIDPASGGMLYTIGFTGALANANQTQLVSAAAGGAAATVTTAQNGAAGGITVTQTAVPGGNRYAITFGGPLSSTNVPQMTAGGGSFQPVIGTTLDGTGAEVQSVQVIASNGSYTLRFGGQTTAAIDFNAPAAQVQTALNALSSVGRAEVQSVQVTGAAGTFTLTFNGQTTAPLPVGASDAAVQAALNGLSTIGGLSGSTVVTSAVNGTTTTYTVTFRGALDNANQTLLIAAGAGGATTGVIPVQDGGGVTVTGVPVGGGSLFTVSFVGYLGISDQPLLTAGPIVGAPVLTFNTVQNGQQGTVVNAGGTLQVSGGMTMTNELVTINGLGFNNQGALNNFSGNNTWSAPLTLGSNASIGTTGAIDVFTFTLPITDNGSGFGVDVVGPGTVVYTAQSDNLYTGTTTVRQGTLRLSQPTGLAILGPLVVGGFGTPATVIETVGNQIANTAPVTVNDLGTFDLNGLTDVIGNLAVNGTGQVFTRTAGNLTTSTITMVGGTITVGNNGTLTSGDVSMTGGLITVGLGTAGTFTAGNVTMTGGTIAGGAGSKVTTLNLTATNGAVSVGVNGELTMATVNTTNGSIAVGDGGTLTTGNLTANGTTISAGNSTTVDTGNVALTGGSLAVGNTSTVTTGDITTTGAATVTLGNGVNATTGDIDMTGGSLTAGNTFTLLGGSFTTSGVAVLVGDNADVTVTGVDLTNGSVGIGNTANLTTGDIAIAGTAVTIGDDATLLAGNITMAGGSLTLGLSADVTALDVTMTGAAAVAIGNAATLDLGNVSVGDGAFGVGTGLTAGSKMGNVGVTTGSFAVGDGAAGLTLGNLTVGAGTATFGNNSTLALGNLTVGTGSATFGNNSAVTAGTIGVTGGSVTLGTTDILTAGALSLTNGTFTLGDGTVGSVTSITTTGGTINLNGATTRLGLSGNITSGGQDAINGPGTLDLGASTRTATVADGPTDVDLNITAVVAGAGAGLTKSGPGRLALTAVETFTGPLTINAGDVRVGGTVGQVRLAGGTLSGVGTVGPIGGTAPVPGTVSPGDNGAPSGPFGTLTATGSVTWGAGTTFAVNLRGPSLGASDQLVVSGAGNVINLNGATLAGMLGSGIVNGDTFTIIQATGGAEVTGVFAEPFGASVVFVAGRKFGVTYNRGPNGSVVLTKVLANVTVAVTTNFNPSTLGQPVTFTATVTPEAGVVAGGGTIPTTDTVTFRIGSFTSPPVFVNGAGVAVYTPPASALPGGNTTVAADFSGDNTDFNPGTGTLTGGQTVLVPFIDPLAATVGGSPAPTPAYISPIASPGIQDNIRVTTTVGNEVTTSPTPQTWTVRVFNSSNVQVWTTTFTAVLNTTTFSFPVDATWAGTNSTTGLPVPDGAYTVVASFTDNEWGNTGTTPPVQVVVDNTLPVILPFGTLPTIIAPGTSGAVPTNLPLTTTITEANLASWTVTIRDSAGSVVRTYTNTTSAVNPTWDGRNASGALVPDDAYSITVTAVDRAGNSTTSPSRTVVVLKSAPTLTLSTVTPISYGQTITFTATLTLPTLSAAGAAIATPLLVGSTVNFAYSGQGSGTGSGTVANVAGQLRATFTAPLLDVGAYTINGTTPGSNQFLPSTAAPISLTVTPATLTLRAVDASKVYGAAVPTLTFTLISGLIPGDVLANELTGEPGTTATQTSPVGQYVINQGTLASANYLIVFQNGTLTVTPAALTVTADDKSKGFSAPLPPLTYTVTGLAPFDDAATVVTGALTTQATQSSPIGTYAIEQGTVAANANYTLTFTPGTLTITPAVLRILIDNARRPINTANPVFTAQFVGFLNGDGPSIVQNLTLTTTATIDSPARKYPIFSSTTPTAGNYIVEVVPGTLTVTPLPADVVFGAGAGVVGGVRVFRPNGDIAYSLAVAGNYPGIEPANGIRTAAADFDGDGTTDLVLGSGPGAPTRVTVVSGRTQAEMFSVQPFEAAFVGGVFVTTGDIDGDGIPDLVVTPDQGGGPRVQVYRGDGFGKMADFFGIDDPNFRGGARAAVGDFDNDGFGDVATAAGFLGGPRVSIVDGEELLAGRPTRLTSDFFIFGGSDITNLRNGVFLAAGDVNGDGFADLIGGGGPGGGPRVLTIDGKSLVQNGPETLVPLANFFAGDVNNRGGIRLAVKDLDGDQFADLVAGAGDGAGSRSTWYRGFDLLNAASPVPLISLDPFDAQGVLNGIYVG